MHRYTGLFAIVFVAALVYFVFSQLLHGASVRQILSTFSFRSLQSTSTVSKSPRRISPPVSLPPPFLPYKENITPPQGFSLDQISPYYRKISLSSANPSYSFYSKPQISIRANHSTLGGVNITGWKVKSNRGEIVLPGGVSDYAPSSFVSDTGIVLLSGDYLTVYLETPSPFGKNFRLNECTGYLNNVYAFNPPLPNSCPYVDRSEISSFSGGCQSYIYSLSGCRESDPNRFVGENDASCREFLSNTFNYRGCYNRNRNKQYFLSHEWRAWIKESFPLDREHDRILLFDAQGLLVDEYVY